MPRRSTRARSRLPLLLVPAAVVALAQPIAAAWAGPPQAGATRQRLAAVTIDVSGDSGTVDTEPEFLDGVSGRYRFGPACGASLSAPVLGQLFGALERRSPVTLKTSKADPDARPCVMGVVFYAP